MPVTAAPSALGLVCSVPALTTVMSLQRAARGAAAAYVSCSPSRGAGLALLPDTYFSFGADLVFFLFNKNKTAPHCFQLACLSSVFFVASTLLQRTHMLWHALT